MSVPEGQFKFIFQEEEEQNQSGKIVHPVLQFPVLPQLIKVFKPEWLLHTPTARQRLDQMASYLDQSNQKIVDPELEKLFPEEIYTALYGLKTMLRGRNLNIVNWVLEDSKARFEALIGEALEEE